MRGSGRCVRIAEAVEDTQVVIGRLFVVENGVRCGVWCSSAWQSINEKACGVQSFDPESCGHGRMKQEGAN